MKYHRRVYALDESMRTQHTSKVYTRVPIGGSGDGMCITMTVFREEQTLPNDFDL